LVVVSSAKKGLGCATLVLSPWGCATLKVKKIKKNKNDVFVF